MIGNVRRRLGSTSLAVVIAACASAPKEQGAAEVAPPTKVATSSAAAALSDQTASQQTVEPSEQASPPVESAVIPAEASEGPKNVKAVGAAFQSMLAAEPFGSPWEKLVKSSPAPKDKSGLGKAQTHKDLEHDRIEMQSQVQFLTETGVEARYGAVSIRALRVFRYGKLAGTQLVLEQIGRDTRAAEKFKADALELTGAWAELRKSLGFDPKLRMTRNDLIERKGDADFPKSPLLIQLEPHRTPP